MSRKAAREAAMRLMYEYGITDILDISALYDMPDVLKLDKLTSENIEYINGVLEHYPEKKEEIDGIIDKNSTSWNLSRISKVDLAIMRLAVYEMLYTETPDTIVINEAVDMAKKYSSENSSRFVNGVLGGFLKEKS